ncbi:DUF6137 domain-containing protein [Pseudomonas sp. NPDC096917]|uniref:DUF6137 domain-containing protein n=1 Tax=Pseudomonas sp. NPDC096917 TaxID=3364483 RepID=UPI00383AD82B
MITSMTLHFIRQLIIHTICNVTGEPAKEVRALDRVVLNTRDWEQVFSRLEATLDIQTGMMTSTERALSIDALAHEIHSKLSDDLST